MIEVGKAAPDFLLPVVGSGTAGLPGTPAAAAIRAETAPGGDRDGDGTTRPATGAKGKPRPGTGAGDGDGLTHGSLRLSDLLGGWVVLYFYPRDSTPSCTLEGQDFTALLPAFTALGATVLGLSKDSPRRHENFCRKAGLGVALLSDEEGDTAERYGVWAEKMLAGRRYMGIVRSTVLIAPDGRVAATWSPVKTPGHAAAVLERLQALVAGA